MQKVKPQRDREATRGRLIQAVIDILKKEGFSSLGVNAIADEAGVSKVLIYRYFGDLDGLYKAVAAELDMTKTRLIDAALQPEGSTLSLRERISAALLSAHTGLAGDELTMQLMIGELRQENELTRSLAEARERQGLEASRRAARFIDQVTGEGASASIDMEALIAAFSASIYYLTLRSRTVKNFNGVDIQSDEGWRRLCDALAGVMTAALPRPMESPE